VAIGGPMLAIEIKWLTTERNYEFSQLAKFRNRMLWAR
jgi:hypothetical protein